MTEDKENVLQPQRKNSGKGARGRRRGSGPAASGGVKEGEGESGLFCLSVYVILGEIFIYAVLLFLKSNLLILVCVVSFIYENRLL